VCARGGGAKSALNFLSACRGVAWGHGASAGRLAMIRPCCLATIKATPVVRVTVQVTPAVVGARAASGALMTTAESEEEFGQLSVDSLIALRNALGSDNE